MFVARYNQRMPDVPHVDRADDPETTAALVALLYEELRRVAHGVRRRAPPSATLQTTALIHEAYLKLHRTGNWANRVHFLRTAAVAMRQVLVDAARSRQRAKRGGEIGAPISLEFAEPVLDLPDEQLLQLDDALGRLGLLEPQLAHLVECRFFAGYSEIETAQLLQRSERSVRRDWDKARAFLYREMHWEP